MSPSSGKHLPQEVTEAILRLLPVKSLGRFKSVSKTWNSLISNPQFIKSHLHQNIIHQHETSKLILVSDTKSLYSIDINEFLPYLNSSDDIPATAKQLSFPSPPIQWEEILGSCNGLILAKEEINTIFLVNPTTHDLLKIPNSPFALPYTESFFMYGFGYDSSSGDYKVVSVSFWDADNGPNPDWPDMYVSVYSLLNNSWKKLPNSPYNNSAGHMASGVLVNQNLHWLMTSNTTYSIVIVGFSLADEVFNEIEFPDSIAEEKAVYNELAVIGGKLAVFNTLDCELWVMEEYGVGESWNKVCMRGVELDCFKPVCLVDGSDWDIVLANEDEVVVYNVDERRCRNVRIDAGPSGFSIGGTYFESLESPAKCIRRAP